MTIEHFINLSTTEPNNDVGIIKIRQSDEQTQTLVVQITENGVPKDFTGYQPFFCAKLGQTAGLGIIEQKVTGAMNPANGTLEYVMQPEDWQQLGRQTAYFSFRKMVNDHEWTEQFSTRDFNYNVTKSAFSEGLREVKKDGSTYIWTIEDMLRLFKEYMATGKIDWENYKNDERTIWEKFVEDNREFLETADPGGKIILELLGARGGATTLGERFDNQIGLSNEFRGFEADESFMKRVYNEQSERGVNVKWFGAIGDGVTDDTTALQTAIDFAFQNKLKVYIPKGYYLVTKPLLIQGYNRKDQSHVQISGSGVGITHIIRKGKETFTIADETPFKDHGKNIDSVFILLNPDNYSGLPITEPWSSQSTTYNISIQHLSIRGDDLNNTENGIFALGFGFCTFTDNQFEKCNHAMQTKRYNTYSVYKRLEVERCLNGFTFLTPIWGNTTMNFSDIHLNGVNEVGYNIKGKAMFKNCSSDGGALQPFKFTSNTPIIPTTAEINSCHFESPAAKGVISLQNAHVTMNQCEIEIPLYLNSDTFVVKDRSSLNINDSRLDRGSRGSSFPSKSSSKMLDVDKTSTVLFNNLIYKGELYEVQQPYVDLTKKLLFSYLNTYRKVYSYISYIESNIIEENYPTTVINKNALVTLKTSGVKTDNTKGSVGFVLDEKINVDEFSKIIIDYDVLFNSGEGDSNLYSFSLNLLNVKPTEGSVYKGDLNIPFIKSDSVNTSGNKRQLIIDVSNLYGDYWIEFRCGGKTDLTIKNLYLRK